MSNKMGGVKRKEAPSAAVKSEKKQKTSDGKTYEKKYEKPVKRSHLEEAADNDGDDDDDADTGAMNSERADMVKGKPMSNTNAKFKLDGSSAEAHQKQRQLAKERKAAKPNADVVHRSKQLWEKLRRKSHVPKEEREELLTELFTIIDGRVRDFVFKHDSVRVVQCAIKYARPAQLKGIVKELQGDVRDLVESRYGKFLVAKMVVQGDREDKDLIIPQFYGNIKRLINHPEASWIVDDIYRQVATPQQKAMMLREWYGAEYAIEGKQYTKKAPSADVTADLVKILEESPEKRKPFLGYLRQLINNLIQKKMTGFTMLHDAMLQYFLALPAGSEDHTEFLEILRNDIDSEENDGGGDLYRNLAFTKSGSRLVCLAIAHGSAKARKQILKCFKNHIETMAFDQYARMVLVTGLDVTDDTKLTSQTILTELLGLKNEDTKSKHDRLEAMITNLDARLPILYPLAGTAKWLCQSGEKETIDELHAIRSTTSKKAPEQRREELLKTVSEPLLELVSNRASNLITSSFGTQAISEILLSCTASNRASAASAVAALATDNPLEDSHIAKDAAVGRMFKTLVTGGAFDPATKSVTLSEPRLGFGSTLYPIIKDNIVNWATSDSSFVVVALLESEDVDDATKKSVRKALEKGKKEIKKAAEGGKGAKAEVNEEANGGGKNKKRKVESKGNVGARILLEKL
ncbi:Putative armadillo-like helical, CPL domain, pumilio domain-containing protein [Septoria linicola]|uniref:Armadillo-like helical, CPL domain, pumilio domain-containing protein n=1 Tax=Septoria linicola TaxID=215465 RepID=A0A9Q9AIP1_9PEZI|nr:putative armadillo-like helical, CPL domain, pumilio domain-containing protein [Septoria linicola]USW46903.1 Putative armadillo-like helical, CPL domain, pumilio domain-containing protein [Septoria linicola]